ncbi:MAG: TIGR02302 family protein [Rhodobacteraceae bacterium]|nr:TIGR02302 family protein [Paracoccaceae bacterium]
MANPSSDQTAVLKSLTMPLALTRAGMISENLWRAFWPLIAVVLVVLAALMLGLPAHVAAETVWIAGAGAAVAALAAAGWGARRLAWPSRAAALARLDATLPGRPIQALLDDQAIGLDDAESAAVWRAHQARMAARASTARPVRPDLRIARRDPYALRYVAALAFAVALAFGSVLRVGDVSDLAPGGAVAATGPTWEGWVEPPRYTGLPTLYLNDITTETLRAPEGSRITLRFYGSETETQPVTEDVSGRPLGEAAAGSAADFTVAQSGGLTIGGAGGRSWQIEMIPDAAPTVAIVGSAEAAAEGEMTLPFEASDDYAVTGGRAEIALDLGAVTRAHGLAAQPEPRPAIEVPLPMPIAGSRDAFAETLIEDFSKHPFANLPVTISLTATDALEQEGAATPFATILPGRRFFDPMAAAIIEQRRDLLWTRENAGRVAQVLRAISHLPDDIFRSETAYLRLRVILRRLETFNGMGLRPAQQEELAEALWELAVLLEEGDLGDALERLRRAQDRLSEAMKNGASDQEIAELMQELREATDDYIRQLSRQAQQDGESGDQQQGQQSAQNQMQMGQDDLQRMMDRIQELMEQGRMAEAQQALQELQQMMENMRVTQGQGQGGQSEGQRAMEGLAETLRNQQGLSDQAFRDLQEQFNPGAQAGENQGNEGRNGGQGRGQSHEGQGGQGNQQAEGQGEGDSGSQQGEGSMAETLADRQRQLREELQRQQGQLPGSGTAEGDAARDALDRAGRAMTGAENALREDNYAGAIDRQSDAMEALREGMRALGEQMAQEQRNQQGQGDQDGDMRAQNRDPLGRNAGSNGSLGTDEGLLQGEDVYRRARDLLDEIRRRSGEGARPEIELEYLKRLLDRF